MTITINDINPQVLEAEYAVRGAIVIRAMELKKDGNEIIFCNIGNPQALGQTPITYGRQLMAILHYPKLLQYQDTLHKIMEFPLDIIERARQIVEKHDNLIGSYSNSDGVPFIKEAVAEFIRERDMGIPVDPDFIFLTDGASKGVDLVLKSLIKDDTIGIMTPVPQYPLYSADITLFGGRQVDYYLDEQNNWQLDHENMEEVIEKAKQKGTNIKSIVVINPNNPTGSLLSYKNIEMIIKFAKKHKLSIIADEVYQENVYNPGDKFVSFAKVMHDLNEKDVSLFSFHSTSKGLLGECGYRGGYIEFRNVPKDVRDVLLKMKSISLCSNLSGQLMTYLMVKPPKPGDESYDLYVKETKAIKESLARRARIIGEKLNAIEGITCEIPPGAMYAFPRLDLPKRDYQINNRKVAPDFHFCYKLVEETGVCTVPGSGFGQEEGTNHLRITILPPEDKIEEVVQKIADFYPRYIANL